MSSGASGEWRDIDTATLNLGSDDARGSPVAYLEFVIGSRTGEMTVLYADSVVTFGCGDDADLVLADSGVSAAHAEIACDDKGVRVRDLGSEHGTFVNGERVEEKALADRDDIGLGARVVARFIYAEALEESRQERIYDSGVCDQVTGLPNEQYFVERLEDELSWSKRHQAPLVLMAIVVDNLKDLTEGADEAVVDGLLTKVGKVLRQSLRTEDLLGRLNEGEFVVACRGIRAQIGVSVADRLRRQVAACSFDGLAEDAGARLSAGVAGLPDPRLTSTTRLLRASLKALEQALEEGGDRSVLDKGPA